MSTKINMTDAERSAVEQEVIAFYKEMFDAFMALDLEAAYAMWEDPYKLGTIYNGVFHPDLDVLKEGLRKEIAFRTRQEIKAMDEVHVAVFSPAVAVVTGTVKVAIYFKDYSKYLGLYGTTALIQKKEDKWTCIHFHQSWNEVED